MIVALTLALTFAGPDGTIPSDPYSLLSQARASYEVGYVSPTNPKFQALDNLGTNGLGNPYYRWYFPACSADFKLWIVIENDMKSGSLVHQVKSGYSTVTDWVLDLERSGPSDPVPKGTLATMLKRTGFKVSGMTTKSQQALLEAMRGYVGFELERDPSPTDIGTWYVGADAKPGSTTLNCTPDFPPHGSYGSAEVTAHPPVTREESSAMGLPPTIWHGPGHFTIASQEGQRLP